MAKTIAPRSIADFPEVAEAAAKTTEAEARANATRDRLAAIDEVLYAQGAAVSTIDWAAAALIDADEGDDQDPRVSLKEERQHLATRLPVEQRAVELLRRRLQAAENNAGAAILMDEAPAIRTVIESAIAAQVAAARAWTVANDYRADLSRRSGQDHGLFAVLAPGLGSLRDVHSVIRRVVSEGEAAGLKVPDLSEELRWVRQSEQEAADRAARYAKALAARQAEGAAAKARAAEERQALRATLQARVDRLNGLGV